MLGWVVRTNPPPPPLRCTKKKMTKTHPIFYRKKPNLPKETPFCRKKNPFLTKKRPRVFYQKRTRAITNFFKKKNISYKNKYPKLTKKKAPRKTLPPQNPKQKKFIVYQIPPVSVSDKKNLQTIYVPKKTQMILNVTKRAPISYPKKPKAYQKTPQTVRGGFR